jgi:hypothetical protein
MYILGNPRQRIRGWSEPRIFLLILTGPKDKRERFLGF